MVAALQEQSTHQSSIWVIILCFQIQNRPTIGAHTVICNHVAIAGDTTDCHMLVNEVRLVWTKESSTTYSWSLWVCWLEYDNFQRTQVQCLLWLTAGAPWLPMLCISSNALVWCLPIINSLIKCNLRCNDSMESKKGECLYERATNMSWSEATMHSHQGICFQYKYWRRLWRMPYWIPTRLLSPPCESHSNLTCVVEPTAPPDLVLKVHPPMVTHACSNANADML